jgi:AraC-like DNA-binding protein
MDDRIRVIEALSTSRIFREYSFALANLTGVSLCLSEYVGAAEGNSGGMQSDTRIETVSASLYRLAIPVCDGIQTVAVLRTGPILEGNCCRNMTKHRGPGSFDKSPKISREQVIPLLKLLEIFAEQLGHLSNRIVLHQNHCEPGIVTRAKQHIHLQYQNPLQLKEVAKQVHVSSYYLCKLFKKSTGLNFSNYIARVRVEAAKVLLDKPNFRINEIGLEVGFPSLTHFNRVFKRFIGLSPRAYRKRTPSGNDLLGSDHRIGQ